MACSGRYVNLVKVKRLFKIRASIFRKMVQPNSVIHKDLNVAQEVFDSSTRWQGSCDPAEASPDRGRCRTASL